MRPHTGGTSALTVNDLIQRLEVLRSIGRGENEVVIEVGMVEGNNGWCVERLDLLEVGFHMGEDDPIVVLSTDYEGSRGWGCPLYVWEDDIEIWEGAVKIKSEGDTFAESDDIMRTLVVDENGSLVRLPREEE